jgi:phosphomannomutase
MAAQHHGSYVETLTGFKWLARVENLVYGYEEALGYAVAPDVVRDKDGISAALLVAELAAQLKLDGSSLPERLEELAASFGRHATDQISVRVADLSIISNAMARLRLTPPQRLLDEPATFTDLLVGTGVLPATDAVRLTWAGGRVVIRPSGTEPKLKAYLEVVVGDGSAELAAARIAALRAEVLAALDL